LLQSDRRLADLPNWGTQNMTSFPQPRGHANGRNPEERAWRVVGRIAGRYLPSTSVQIGSFTVGPLPEGIEVLERVKGLKAAPTDDAYHAYYIGRGGNVDVKSGCYFWIDKIAKSAEAAIDTASKDIALLQSAFSLRNDGDPYYVEILWATDGKHNFGNYAPSIKFTVWLPEELAPAMLSEIVNDYRILKTRDTARTAASFLFTATRQDAMVGDDVAAREEALLSYFKVIELIASRTSREESVDRERKQQEILVRLNAILNSKKMVSKKVSAVWDAHTRLSRLEGRYLSLKIEAAANKLRLSDDWMSAAKKLAWLRNTRLGHAGSRTNGDEGAIVQWDRVAKETGYTASRLAREMLMTYVDRSRKDQR
jgi:hypothetical protein